MRWPPRVRATGTRAAALTNSARGLRRRGASSAARGGCSGDLMRQPRSVRTRRQAHARALRHRHPCRAPREGGTLAVPRERSVSRCAQLRCAALPPTLLRVANYLALSCTVLLGAADANPSSAPRMAHNFASPVSQHPARMRFSLLAAFAATALAGRRCAYAAVAGRKRARVAPPHAIAHAPSPPNQHTAAQPRLRPRREAHGEHVVRARLLGWSSTGEAGRILLTA